MLAEKGMRARISHELFESGASLVGARPKIRNHPGAKQWVSLTRGSRYGFMHKVRPKALLREIVSYDSTPVLLASLWMTEDQTTRTLC
jgi:hypothetical protein